MDKSYHNILKDNSYFSKYLVYTSGFSDLKEFIANVSDPSKQIYLDNQLSKDKFMKNFRLTIDSSFYSLFKSIFNYHEVLKENFSSLNNQFINWKNTTQRKPNNLSKTWKAMFSDLNVSPKDKIFEFMFCLETSYFLFTKIIILKACEDYDVKFRFSIELLNILSPFTNNNNILTVGWPITLKKLIKKFDYSLVESFSEDTMFNWWGLELHEYLVKNNLLDLNKKPSLELEDFSISLAQIVLNVLQYNFSGINGDPLGDLYQLYFDKDSRKALGEFYTPGEVVEYILDAVGYNNESVLNKRLFDPACGSGTFIISALRRYLCYAGDKYNEIDQHYWSTILSNICSNNMIFGLDINPFAVHMSQIQFMITILPFYKKAIGEDSKFIIDSIPIFQVDSLLDISEQKFISTMARDIQIPLGKKELAFDYIVGNPPYVNTRGINKDKKVVYESKFTTARGLYDLYCLFIERGINLLKPAGKLGFITSNQFIITEYGKYLRQLLVSNSFRSGYIRIEELLDFRDSKVFKDVVAYPCILVLSYLETKVDSSSNNILCARVPGQSGELFITIKNFKNKNYEVIFSPTIDLFRFSQQVLNFEPWILMPQIEKTVFQAIYNNADCLLGDITENIFVGTQTSLDSVFLCKKKFDNKKLDNQQNIVVIVPNGYPEKSFEIEKSILKRVLKGKDVSKWQVDWSQNYLIFPYETQDKALVINQEKLQKDFPLTFQYFNHFSEVIKNRERSKFKDKDEWYIFGRANNHNLFEQPKLISQLLSRSNRFSFDQTGSFYFVAVGGNCLTLQTPYNSEEDYFFILGLLNSSLMSYVAKHISPVHEGGFYLYTYNYIKKFPIILNSANSEIKNQIISLVREIFNNYEKKGTKFSNSETYDVKKMAKLLVKKNEPLIDELVYSMYKLDSEMINVINNFNNKY